MCNSLNRRYGPEEGIADALNIFAAHRIHVCAFDVLQRQAKVQRIRLHDLRHTHATLLFNDGKNIKMISQRLGHADVGITLSVYAHLAHDAQDEAADSIDGLIFGTCARDSREVAVD